jgi:hypothetical protein
MNKETIQQLREELKHAKHYNMMAPFPVYDTEYVEELENMINDIEKHDNEYDDLPVEACKNCKSLHIVVDETDNNICMRCNSINETVEYVNIYEYKKQRNIWND